MPISKVGSKGIKDAELSAADIAPGTITSDKIAPGTIANDRLAGSIANAKLANSSTTINAKLAGSISNDKLAGSISNDKLAGSIANAKLANSSVTLNGSSVSLGGSASIGTQWQAEKTNSDSPITAVAGYGYFLNSTSGTITINLPSSPSVGDEVDIIDSRTKFSTNNVTVGRGGSNIEGAASHLSASAFCKTLTGICSCYRRNSFNFK